MPPTEIPPALEPVRWGEYLPVRGKWARMLILPLVLVLWALWGIRFVAPDGNTIETRWDQFPQGYPIPQAQLNGRCAIPASGAMPRR